MRSGMLYRPLIERGTAMTIEQAIENMTDADPRIFMTIEDGQLKAYTGRSDKGLTLTAANYEDFFLKAAAAFSIETEDLQLLCSSSIDFPEEFTSDPAVLALVKRLFF